MKDSTVGTCSFACFEAIKIQEILKNLPVLTPEEYVTDKDDDRNTNEEKDGKNESTG